MPAEVAAVPAGYVVHRIGDTALVFDAARTAELVPLRLADPERRRALFARAALRGRGRAPSVPLSPDASILLRRYRHGGLFGSLLGPHFLGPERALSELEVTTRAERSGAPVPHVLCLALWPGRGPFWSALIGTREERGALELQQALRACGERAERCALARRVGHAVRQLHDSGIEHADLQVRNVLLTRETAAAPARIVIVDLDRARLHREARIPGGRRAANLGRLARSVVKDGLWGAELGRRELAAFVSGYVGGSRPLRAELRRFVLLERLKLWLHRITWRPRGVG